MPGALVSSVEPLYVPLSRRRVLRGWKDFYQSRPDADAWSRREHKARRNDMRLIQKVGEWLDLRLQLGGPIRETAEHPVPRETASWFYVFGSAALTCFMLQIVTGILLAMIYVPSAGEAWNSLQTLNHDIT